MREKLIYYAIQLGLKYGFIEADYSGEVLLNCIIINKLLRSCNTKEQVMCCDKMVSNMFNTYGIKYANAQTAQLVNDIQFKLIVCQASGTEPKPKDDVVTERELDDEIHD